MSVIETSIYIVSPGKEYDGYTRYYGKSELSIKFYPPQGIAIDHFRVKLNEIVLKYASTYLDKIEGYFRQYDANENLLSEQPISITRNNSIVIQLANSNVDHIELFITQIEILRSAGGLNFNYADTIVTDAEDIGKEIIRISTEDADNNETSALSIKFAGIIYTWKPCTSVQVTGQNPTREIPVNVSNTANRIKKIYIVHESITGSYDESDKVKIELLDSGDNVLDSKEIDLPTLISNGYDYLDFNLSTAKIRVSLITSKRIIETLRIDAGYNVLP